MKNRFKNKSLKEILYKVIFESDTLAGKVFDIVLIILILLSIVLVMLESISFFNKYLNIFRIFEWIFTIIFTIEYIIRIFIVEKKRNYIFSFFGIVDFIASIPSYFTLIFNLPIFIFIRALRLLRIFRILKLWNYLKEGKIILTALKNSFYKISVFLITILTLIIVISGIIYFIEGPDNGYTSIPKSMYWTIVTLTTVGYGDISPKTPLGQFIASLVMIMGYAIIAVPTGIYTVEMSKVIKTGISGKVCSACLTEEHRSDAKFCYKCGNRLD
ncbi:MAG TPA: ion transporter [Spirochaetota bacterium]|nr:ion transporter [Spirochaetota bacterium]